MKWNRLLIPLLMASGCQQTALAQSDEFQTFKLTGIDGYISASGNSDTDKSHQTSGGGIEQGQSSSEVRTDVFVMTHSYVYHPKFLTLDIGGGPVFTAGRNETDGASSESKQSLFNYNVRARFLADKPFNGQVFYDQLHPAQTLSIGEVTNEQIEKYGFGLNLLSPLTPIPMSLEAEHRFNTGTGASRVLDDELKRVSMRGSSSLGEAGRTQFSYSSQTQDSRSGSLNSPILAAHSESEGLNVENQFWFGSMREHDLRNSVSYNVISFASGQNPITTVDDARIVINYQTAYATPRRLFANYQFGRSRQNDLANYSDAAAVGLSSAKVGDIDWSTSFGSDNTWTDQFKTRSMALNGYANYSRQMPIGKTEVSYSLRYEDRQQIAMAPNSAIIGEALTLNTISPVALGQIRVVPGSVSVWNQTRSQSYTEGIDYVLTVVSLTTRIQRVPSGNILDGQTVLVDYEIDVGGTYANTQLDQSVGLSFMPAPYMSFFLRYSDSTAKLTSGSPTSFLNGYTSTVYGFNANGPLWFSPRFFVGGRVEREERRELLNPFVRMDADAYITGGLASLMYSEFRFGVRQSNVWADNPLQVVDLTGYNLSLTWRQQSGLRWSLVGNRETDVGQPQRRQRTFAQLRAAWRYRMLSMTGDLTASREAYGDFVRDRTVAQVSLRRDF
ncbi:MAG: hypothetical protein KA740_05005 [Rhodoferax sp.]|jgi:hypothetical protein|nr:hypothetical protein [Rhodoferax sp.]